VRSENKVAGRRTGGRPPAASFYRSGGRYDRPSRRDDLVGGGETADVGGRGLTLEKAPADDAVAVDEEVADEQRAVALPDGDVFGRGLKAVPGVQQVVTFERIDGFGEFAGGQGSVRADASTTAISGTLHARCNRASPSAPIRTPPGEFRK
jgi:hypothetical protein